MALTFLKLFAPTMLTTSAVTIYTVPSAPTTNVLKNASVRLTNVTALAVSATLYAVPSGGSASTTNECLAAFSIAANSYLDIAISDLAAGDFLQALAGSATSINIQSLGGVLFS